MAITSVKNRPGGRGRNLSRLYSFSSSFLLSGFFSHSRISSMIRARGKSVSGNMAILHPDRPRSGPVFTKGWQYFPGQNQPRKRDISPISAAAQVFTKPSVLLNSLRRLFDVFQQVPRLTVQQGAKPLYVLPGQPFALPQLLKRGLT